MPTALEFTTAADVPLTSLSFSAAPGTPTAWQTVRLWNDRAATGADVARNLSLSVLGRVAGSSSPYVASGLELLDQRGVELRFDGTLVSIGAGASASLPAIEPETYLTIELRVRAGSALAVAAVELAFGLSSSFYVDLGAAVLGPGGVEVGDQTSWLGEGGAVGPESPESGFVQIAPGLGVVAGASVAWSDVSLELGEVDGDGHTLTAGEAYAALVVVGLDGPEIVRGAAVESPPAASDDPDAGGLPVLARVVKSEGADVAAGDIDDRRTFGGMLVEASGLSLSVGPGTAIVGTRRVRWDVPQGVSMPPSATRVLTVLPDGSLELAVTAPVSRGERLATVTSGASAVTGLVDERRYVGGWICSSVTLSGANSSALVDLPASGVHLRPYRPIRVMVAGDPAALGNTSGSWVVDLEAFGPELAWSDVALGAEVAYDAADVVVQPLPELARLEGPCLLRATLSAVPAGGAPADVAVSVWWRPAAAGGLQ